MKSAIDKFVVNRVKQKRVEKGFTQLQLANELNLSVGFIGKIESNNYPAHYNIKHLNLLAKIFNCSPKDFLPQTPL